MDEDQGFFLAGIRFMMFAQNMTMATTGSTRPHVSPIQNNNSSNGNTAPRMAESSVLAESFVQQKFRVINELAATTRIGTTQPPLLNYSSVTVAPSTPVCYCEERSNGITMTNNPSNGTSTSNGQSNEVQPQHNLRLPLSVATDMEFGQEAFYAIQKRRERLDGTGSPETNVNKPQDGSGKGLPKVDNTTQDMKIYTNNWRTIIQAERRKKLLMYERYSQFNHPVTRIPSTANSTATNDGKGTTRTSISIRIRGMADAKPTPQPGDVLLIRPLRYLSLPHDWRMANRPDAWSQPVHLVEVTSILTDVVRANPAARPRKVLHGQDPNSPTLIGDQLIATWLEAWVDMNG